MRMNIQNSGGNPDEVLSSAQKDGTLIGLIARLKDEGTIQWLIEQSTIVSEAPAPKPEPESEVTEDG